MTLQSCYFYFYVLVAQQRESSDARQRLTLDRMATKSILNGLVPAGGAGDLFSRKESPTFLYFPHGQPILPSTPGRESSVRPEAWRCPALAPSLSLRCRVAPATVRLPRESTGCRLLLSCVRHCPSNPVRCRKSLARDPEPRPSPAGSYAVIPPHPQPTPRGGQGCLQPQLGFRSRPSAPHPHPTWASQRFSLPAEACLVSNLPADSCHGVGSLSLVSFLLLWFCPDAPTPPSLSPSLL